MNFDNIIDFIDEYQYYLEIRVDCDNDKINMDNFLIPMGKNKTSFVLCKTVEDVKKIIFEESLKMFNRFENLQRTKSMIKKRINSKIESFDNLTRLNRPGAGIYHDIIFYGHNFTKDRNDNEWICIDIHGTIKLFSNKDMGFNPLLYKDFVKPIILLNESGEIKKNDFRYFKYKLDQIDEGILLHHLDEIELSSTHDFFNFISEDLNNVLNTDNQLNKLIKKNIFQEIRKYKKTISKFNKKEIDINDFLNTKEYGFFIGKNNKIIEISNDDDDTNSSNDDEDNEINKKTIDNNIVANDFSKQNIFTNIYFINNFLLNVFEKEYKKNKNTESNNYQREKRFAINKLMNCIFKKNILRNNLFILNYIYDNKISNKIKKYLF